MIDFVRKMLALVRPYRTRLVLGIFCGILYGLMNGFLVVLLQVVIDLLFGDTPGSLVTDPLKHVPAFLRPALQQVWDLIQNVKGPASNQGKILLIAMLPLVMVVRSIMDYLSTYLTNWAAVRALADLRTRLFDHLQNLSLGFFSKARTGDLIARVVNDTHILHTVITNSLGNLAKGPITILSLLPV